MVIERCQQVDRGGVVLYSLFGNWGNGRVELSWAGQFPPKYLRRGRLKNRWSDSFSEVMFSDLYPQSRDASKTADKLSCFERELGK